jgi:hypothetical protein
MVIYRYDVVFQPKTGFPFGHNYREQVKKSYEQNQFQPGKALS